MQEHQKRIITGSLISLLILGLFFVPSWLFVLISMLILMRIILREWPRLFSPKDPLFWLLMPIYPLLPVGIIIYLQLYGYAMLNLLLFSLVAIYDTFSYMIGKKWGAHLISPTISPGKSWEGFFGGVVCSCLFSFIFFGHHSILTFLSRIVPFVFALCSAALAGDLFESMLKRRAGLKDAGSLLPGHGGILDRIDGILFAAGIVFFARATLMFLLA